MDYRTAVPPDWGGPICTWQIVLMLVHACRNGAKCVHSGECGWMGVAYRVWMGVAHQMWISVAHECGWVWHIECGCGSLSGCRTFPGQSRPIHACLLATPTVGQTKTGFTVCACVHGLLTCICLCVLVSGC